MSEKKPVINVEDFIALLIKQRTATAAKLAELPSSEDLLKMVAESYTSKKKDATVILKVGEAMNAIKQSEFLRGQVEVFSALIQTLEKAKDKYYESK